MTRSPSALAREAGTSPPKSRLVRRRLSASHLLISVAVILAFGLNLLALQDRTATTMVAVADRQLAAGSALSSADVRMVPVAAAFAGLGSLLGPSEISSMDGWIVQRSLESGDLLDVSMLSRPAAPGGLRSMSLPVEIEHAAGGTLTVGDRVDVVSVADGAAGYVAIDLEVVGVADDDGGGLGGLGSYHIVVAVTASEALSLSEAIEAGSVEVIRSTGAKAIEMGVEVDDP